MQHPHRRTQRHSGSLSSRRPGKPERLSETGAGAIISSLADLALKIRARKVSPELLQLSLQFQGRTSGAPGLTAPAVNSEDGREQPRGKEGQSGPP